VRCEWRQVVVLTSTQQAMDLVARLALDPGDAAWIEDPGYLGARAALRAAGAHAVPVPVDGEGLDVSAGEALAPRARLAYVTPSHQYPLGATLSLARRLQLLNWAGRAGAWILEDDYDSEFRFAGRPLAAVQGLDTEGRVLYAGTFNKVMFPSLRLAYLVVPPALVDAFVAARALSDGCPPALTQAALADFIEQGHFAAHVRRMRAIYQERRDALRESAERHLAGRLTVEATDTGMHAVGWLAPDANDVAVSNRAATLDLDVPPLSKYYLGPTRRPGLLLSYAVAAPGAIRRGVRRLAEIL
ncbi:MAG: PLP-dependent aminotransferase family protein, partial [Gemmatimonadaceae bacterium]